MGWPELPERRLNEWLDDLPDFNIMDKSLFILTIAALVLIFIFIAMIGWFIYNNRNLTGRKNPTLLLFL